jgi:hypothetical protein
MCSHALYSSTVRRVERKNRFFFMPAHLYTVTNFSFRCAEARYNDDVVCDSSLDCSLTPLSINRLMQKHKGVLKMHNAAIKFTVRNEQLFVSPLKNSSIFVVNDDDLTEEITDKMTRRVGNGYILKFRSADDDGSEYVLSCEEFCPIEYA